MFKVLTLIFSLFFALTAGVLFGAKKNTITLRTATPQPKLKPLVLKKIHPKIKLKTIEITNISPNLIKKRSGYTVVLASFVTKASAKKHVKEISEQGFKAFEYSTVIKGKRWHRVGLGSFPLKSKAKDLKKGLLKHKFAKGALISKIPRNNQ